MKIIKDSEDKRRPIQLENPQKIKWAHKCQKLLVVCYAFGEEKANKSEACVIELPDKRKYKWAKFTIDFIDACLNWSKDDKYILLQLRTYGKKKIENHLLQVGL